MWQMALIISFPETRRCILGTTADHVASVCPPSIVKHASSDLVAKVPFTSIKVTLSCHLIWMHVTLPRKHRLQQ